jgi:hypothetical protein
MHRNIAQDRWPENTCTAISSSAPNGSRIDRWLGGGVFYKVTILLNSSAMALRTQGAVHHAECHLNLFLVPSVSHSVAHQALDQARR